MEGNVGKTKQEWEETISVILKDNLDAFNEKDFSRLAQCFSTSAHRLVPKFPVAIGREAIEDQYRNGLQVVVESIELTYLRYHSDDAAVFEFASRIKDLGITWKGLVLVIMEGGQPKIASYSCNFDK